MPGGGEHRKWSRRLLGNSHPEVHKWIDLPHRWMGRNHRKLFHDPISAPTMGFFAALCHGKNPITGAAAGLLHTGQDSIDSALGGAKIRRARKRIGSFGGLFLPLLVVLAIFALPALIIIAIVEATSKSTDSPAICTASQSSTVPPPPNELETFVLESHRAGKSRREVAMELFSWHHKCEDVQSALSIVPKEDWAAEKTEECLGAAPEREQARSRSQWTRP